MTAVRAMSAAELVASREVNASALDYIEIALCKAARNGSAVDGFALFAARRPQSRNLELLRRAAVAPGMTTDPTWAGPLAQLDTLVSAFGALLRPAEILGQLLPRTRQVPFNIKVPRQTAGASAGWVGEGKPAPFAALAFASDDFGFSKVMALVAITQELARSGRPDAVTLVSKDLVKASAAAVDQALLDPTWTGTPGISPASITHGAPTVAASGKDVTAFRLDAPALISAMVAAGTALAAPSWVMSPEQRAALSLMDAALIRDDGTLAGWPVLTTTSPAVAGRIVLIDASELNVADLGAEVDSSEEATVEIAAPATDPPTAATVLQSLWMVNLTCLRVVRYANWAKTQPGAAGYISGANYGLA